LYHEDNRKLYHAVYDKRTGTTSVGLQAGGFIDDLTRFLPLQPLSVSATGEYAGLISVDEIQAWFDEHAGQGVSDEALKLKQLNEDDNPVVVIVK
jgi:hypothetical protein